MRTWRKHGGEPRKPQGNLGESSPDRGTAGARAWGGALPLALHMQGLYSLSLALCHVPWHHHLPGFTTSLSSPFPLLRFCIKICEVYHLSFFDFCNSTSGSPTLMALPSPSFSSPLSHATLGLPLYHIPTLGIVIPFYKFSHDLKSTSWFLTSKY